MPQRQHHQAQNFSLKKARRKKLTNRENRENIIHKITTAHIMDTSYLWENVEDVTIIQET